MAAGLSQAALAEKVGVTPNYVGILERGEKLPTLDTLVALAKALGVNAGELLDDTRGDAWLDEVIAVAASVPKGRRELVLAVLKAMATPAGGG